MTPPAGAGRRLAWRGGRGLETTPDHPMRSRPTPSRGFASGVERVPVLFVNAYLVGEPGRPRDPLVRRLAGAGAAAATVAGVAALTVLLRRRRR
jgi:hypothetical protein